MRAMLELPKPLNVLILSGHDPSGGAGFQADIEAVGALGAHGAGVLTALTRQDSANAYDVWPVAHEHFAAMLDTLLADMAFAAVKIGLLGSAEQAQIIANALSQRLPAGTPVVLDPVLVAGGGGTLAADPVAAALIDTLFPLATVITPNAAEARRLCGGTDSLDACAAALSQPGRWALVTGGDEPGELVVNRLYYGGDCIRRYRWPKLDQGFHGAGCTLAAALAAALAVPGAANDIPAAAARAQEYVQDALAAGFAPGGGRAIPNRWRRGQAKAASRR